MVNILLATSTIIGIIAVIAVLAITIAVCFYLASPKEENHEEREKKNED